jgi:hypothetical protein
MELLLLRLGRCCCWGSRQQGRLVVLLVLLLPLYCLAAGRCSLGQYNCQIFCKI